jgi:hypothetical protein
MSKTRTDYARLNCWPQTHDNLSTLADLHGRTLVAELDVLVKDGLTRAHGHKQKARRRGKDAPRS